ncbi:Oidioi.mRNA.OKI2018_I69.XSR.g14067.t1.cds [Oikopleura dioica]|uniref:Oidioi.mRNA.OKI2018_I69.XSR.g14067.t1.cds n=1 Tax=Oikopleura dioica TaxID=34765 RepID=A0ABN7SFZ3_OIKDI|nr:Oidioi.mRNA.OKI2018_I69.XSR.g14067.t1.cds [Oikopleura dioica]
MKLSLALFSSVFCDTLPYDTQCTSIGGTCTDYRYLTCIAGYATGKCNGDNNRKCCLPCDTSCQLKEESDSLNDGKCTSAGGECKHNTNYCNGYYSSGLCGGGSARQCCKTGSTNCELLTYSNTWVKGYNGLTVKIDQGFKSAMDTMNNYAGQCGVTVYVTHAFRKEGQEIGGTVVPPASHSNHLTGHAIDMNLDTPRGWCNSSCLAAESNTNAKCFTDKIIANAGLRWGQSFNDPVHIDDNLWYSNSNTWTDLYYKHQNSCS